MIGNIHKIRYINISGYFFHLPIDHNAVYEERDPLHLARLAVLALIGTAKPLQWADILAMASGFDEITSGSLVTLLTYQRT